MQLHLYTMHLQVNLSYDVTLALAYISTLKIRESSTEISTSSVFIITGSRAKVIDFGILKCSSMIICMIPLTKCPGTVAYISPEALSDYSKYTDKLDCFSYGALMIQIITQNFPEPINLTDSVHHDSKYPNWYLPVPEVELRKF